MEPGNLQMIWTLWIEYDARGDRHKAWRDFTREATFEIYKGWPFDDGRSALLYMIKHFEKHGGDGLSWLASWLRQKEVNEHERTSIEMRCLITCLHGTYDQLNSPCLAPWKLWPDGVPKLSKPIPVREENHVGPGFVTTKAARAPWTVSIRIFERLLQREPARNWTLKNLRGKFTGVTGAGRQGGAATLAADGADGEGTFAAKGGRPGGSDATTVSQASGERTTAGRIKSLKDGCGDVLDSIFPLPLVHELGPRPQGRRQVRAWLREKRREEDVNALISNLNWCFGSRAPFAADSVPTPRQDLVTARVHSQRSRSQNSEWLF